MDFWIPFGICVILPIVIVLIVFLYKMNSDNKRAQVLIKAIESNNNINTDKLAEAMQKQKGSQLEVLNLRLLRGCIFTFFGIALCITKFVILDAHYSIKIILIVSGAASIAIGISYLVTYFVTRQQVKE